MLENADLKRSLDCMHKHHMEKQEKMREEIADYQRQLQEAEKRHQTLLLDTNKQVKSGVWYLGELETVCRPQSGDVCFARRSKGSIIVML